MTDDRHGGCSRDAPRSISRLRHPCRAACRAVQDAPPPVHLIFRRSVTTNAPKTRYVSAVASAGSSSTDVLWAYYSPPLSAARLPAPGSDNGTLLTKSRRSNEAMTMAAGKDKADSLAAGDIHLLQERLKAKVLEEFYASLLDGGDEDDGLPPTELTLAKLPGLPHVKIVINKNEGVHKEPHFHIVIKDVSEASIAIRDPWWLLRRSAGIPRARLSLADHVCRHDHARRRRRRLASVATVFAR